MRFSTSAIFVIASFTASVSAAPVDVPSASLPVSNLQTDVLSAATGALGSALPTSDLDKITGALESSLPTGALSGLSLPDPLGAVTGEVANITGLLKEVTSLLTTTDLPTDTLDKVVEIVKELINGVITTLGEATGLDGVADSLNSLLDDTLGKLDDLLKNSGLSDTLNSTLDGLLKSLKTLLSKLLWTVNQVLENLFHLNLVGVVVALLSGALAPIDLFLSQLKNGVLPA